MNGIIEININRHIFPRTKQDYQGLFCLFCFVFKKKMVKSKPYSESRAGIHLSLESLTVLGQLGVDVLGEQALGCLFPL